MPKKLEIRIGGMAPPLHEQLNLASATVAKEQKLHDAIVLLKVNRMLSKAEVDHAGNRLARQLARRASNGWLQ